MYNFFNTRNHSNCQTYAAVAGITAMAGNIIWILSAGHSIGPADRAVISCFHHYNVTDANYVPTEECNSVSVGGRGSDHCSIVDVYDQYTIDHCGTQMSQSNNAQQSFLLASVMLLINFSLMAACAALPTENPTGIATALTELMPINSDNNAAYATFAAAEDATHEQAHTNCAV
jgi:hypothetical protein